MLRLLALAANTNPIYNQPTPGFMPGLGVNRGIPANQGEVMTSTDNKAWVDNIVAVNGGSEGYTHIIEYQNQFDGRTAWKLCKNEGIFVYAMETGAFIDPKLIWSKHARMEP